MGLEPFVRAVRAFVRLAAFAIVLLTALVAVLVLRVLLVSAPVSMVRRVGTSSLHWFMRCMAAVLGVRIRASGPVPPPGSLIVANHRSYLDVVALASCFPTTFLAKREVESWPLLGLGARLVSIAFVDRDSAESREAAGAGLVARLEGGMTVANFPEGTTTDADEPLSFRPGLFRRVAGLPIDIVPVRIEYEDRAACWTGNAGFVGHLVKVTAAPATVVRLAFTEPVNAASYPDGDDLRDVCRDRILRSSSAAPTA